MASTATPEKTRASIVLDGECGSSKSKHATKHFHKREYSLMRSIEMRSIESDRMHDLTYNPPLTSILLHGLSTTEPTIETRF
jgi:hypothetical protein